MSEIKLNLVDAERVLHGKIHGSVADACVAALSAEPETIAELEAALARYINPRDAIELFASFHSVDYLQTTSMSAQVDVGNGSNVALDNEPWDAGVVVIDLAARIVATESSYSQPGPEGQVFYHDGQALTDVPVLYRVPADWLFVSSVDAYRWSRDRRIDRRRANPVFDARTILFGRPLLQFIVRACLSLPAETWSAFASIAESATANDQSANEALTKEISNIHARWLLTSREDLHGQSPREVLLAHQDHINFDLHTRSLQWSLQNEGPPCLSRSSFAYRFAGFGTHEWVLYYDLVRYLIGSLVELRMSATASMNFTGVQMDQLISVLEQMKSDWLENPQADLDGRIPAIIIDNERKRLPQAIRPRDMIVDDDCAVCRMFGDETSPLGMGIGFWNLDGSNMDDDFAFSPFRNRQEWEAENRRRDEFHKEFNRKWEERQQSIARGEPVEPDSFFGPEALGAAWGWFDQLDASEIRELEPASALGSPPSDSREFDKSDIH